MDQKKIKIIIIGLSIFSMSFATPCLHESVIDRKYDKTLILKEGENCYNARRRQQQKEKDQLCSGKKATACDTLYEAAKAEYFSKIDQENENNKNAVAGRMTAAAHTQSGFSNVASGAGGAATGIGVAACTAKQWDKCALFVGIGGSLFAASSALSENAKENQRRSINWRRHPIDFLNPNKEEKPPPEIQKPIKPKSPSSEIDEASFTQLNTPTPVKSPFPLRVQQQLNDAGIKVDHQNGKITLPDGSVIDMQNTDELLKTATPAQMEQIEKIMAPVNKALEEAGLYGLKDADSKSSKTDSAKITKSSKKSAGAFTGYKSSGGGGKKSLKALRGLSKNKGNLVASNKRDKFSGMVVKAGNSNIGVKQANIFQMMHDRYQTERKGKTFIEN